MYINAETILCNVEETIVSTFVMYTAFASPSLHQCWVTLSGFVSFFTSDQSYIKVDRPCWNNVNSSLKCWVGCVFQIQLCRCNCVSFSCFINNITWKQTTVKTCSKIFRRFLGVIYLWLTSIFTKTDQFFKKYIDLPKTCFNWTLSQSTSYKLTACFRLI